ncbi:hypothetical protein GA0061101_14926 [Rhizobium lusitanum]|jgi:hypothetical protein|uniref:Uncharacterized protein n=1 Tax=Rhizobium lusitanum TaxID=293958 RepID=A0A1C3XJF0_9HYPH|nr:hypothetical protein GA0061101_14926 [Rhizobium lusitanum]
MSMTEKKFLSVTRSYTRNMEACRATQPLLAFFNQRRTFASYSSPRREAWKISDDIPATKCETLLCQSVCIDKL